MAGTIKYSYRAGYTPLAPREYNDVAVAPLTGACDAPSLGTGKFTSDTPTVLEKTRLLNIAKLPCSWRNVYTVRLDHKMDFIPGDAVGLVVPNSDAAVDRLMALCDIPDGCYRIERTGKAPFTFEGQIRDFFKYRYDISGIPRKIHLLNLAKTSPMKTHMEYICSPEGARDYIGLGLGWHSLVDIIECFGCRPGLEDLVRNCEIIKPRYYTLINSREDSCEILVGEITRQEGPSVKYGHVSGYVNALYYSRRENATSTHTADPAGHRMQRACCPDVEIAFRRNLLVGRIDTECLICFCTGTGIALFLSLYKNRPAGQKTILVYGYRSDEDDISRLYGLECDILRAKSSEGIRVTQHCNIIEPYRKQCSVVICGSMAMQRSTFVEVRRLYPELAAERRIILDNWQ